MISIVNRVILSAAIFPTFFVTVLALAGGQHLTPREVVDLFLQVYGTERMEEILPYTSPSFREGLTPKVWLERTSSTLDRLGYVRLDAAIQSAAIKGNEATVVVTSRVRTKAATARQTEIYSLQRTGQAWHLLDLEVRDEILLDVTATEVG